MEKDKQLHVVLGGAGASGQAVVKELQKRGLPLKVIQRSKKVEGIETVNIDLMDKEKTTKELVGATHVYLCAAVPYDADIWETQWPQLMQNVIDACSLEKAKLIFLDNIYMYGPAPLSIPFDETESQEPQTRKGKVRKTVADMILEAHKSNKIQAVIGRSADFYGPNAMNSTLYGYFLENMLAGRAPQSIGKANVKHTFAYIEDNGKALVSLALDDSTYGQVWHLPVGEPLTVDEIQEIFNIEMKTNFKVSYMSRTDLNNISKTVKIVGEVIEMFYQYETPYVMSFDKFKNHFPDFKVTSYQEGVAAMINSFK